MVNSIKIKPWQSQQSAEPGIKDQYWCSQIHTNPVHGNSHRPGESRKQKKYQSPCVSCKIQEAWKPSNAQKNVWGNKMQTKETSFLSDAQSTKTECDYLNGWNKKTWSHTQKTHPKQWTPEIQLGMQQKKKWCTQAGKTWPWAATACEQKDRTTLLTASLGKRTVPRDTRQLPWHSSKGYTDRSRKESSDPWLHGASLPTRALDTCTHRWLPGTKVEESTFLSTTGQPSSKPFQQESSLQAIPIWQFSIKYRAEVDALQAAAKLLLN